MWSENTGYIYFQARVKWKKAVYVEFEQCGVNEEMFYRVMGVLSGVKGGMRVQSGSVRGGV